MSRSAATRVHPALPPVVHAEAGAGLSIDAAQLTPAALATFKHAAAMANPKFYELQRLRKSTWDTPRFIRGYDLTLDDRLILPRGLRHTITTIVEQAGSRLAVTDVRNPGREIDVAFTAALTTRQSTAVGAVLAHDNGLLVAPPGSGKTVMACALIAERSTSTLVLVDRKALADQWRERIEQFLGIRAGQLGGGRRKLTGIVDIALLPSLARRDDLAALTEGYGHVIVDECHHLGAAAYERSVKHIAARFWLGLTATPTRRDGLGQLVIWQLGPLRHTMTEEEQGTIAAALELEAGPQRLLRVHDTTFEIADVDLDAPGALPAMLAARGHQATVLQGSMSTTDRRAAVDRLADAKPGDGVLVIGTTPFIGEGFDAPALDTLFLTGPVSCDGLLIQCAGRVIRTAPGKETAEVHDYHDPAVPVIAASLQRRMPGYHALGFTRT